MFDPRVGLKQIPWRLCAIGSLFGLGIFILIAGPLIEFHNHPDSFFAFFHSIRPAIRSAVHFSKPKKDSTLPSTVSHPPASTPAPSPPPQFLLPENNYDEFVFRIPRPHHGPNDCETFAAGKQEKLQAVTVLLNDGRNHMEGDYHSQGMIIAAQNKDIREYKISIVMRARNTPEGLNGLIEASSLDQIKYCMLQLSKNLSSRDQAIFQGAFGIGLKPATAPDALAASGTDKITHTPSAP